jgi:hypothetical protein
MVRLIAQTCYDNTSFRTLLPRDINYALDFSKALISYTYHLFRQAV